MSELMINGFEIDGYPAHEMSVFVRPIEPFRILCSKHPNEVPAVRPLLALDPDLWVIYLLRDPRDVVVSRHRQDPTKYFANLLQWKRNYRLARKLAEHPRFVTVRYEDLVADPDAVQRTLLQRMSFLAERAPFSEYHRVAQPSDRSQDALRGVRPISTASVAAWRRHRPRLAGQLAQYGSITEELIQCGYEPDASWLEELEGVEPDHFESRSPDRVPFREWLDQTLWRYKRTVRYALGTSERVPIDTV